MLTPGTPEAGPVPGPAWVETLPPRDPELVRAFLLDIGDQPDRWSGEVPPHLFPQWGLGLLGGLLANQPFPFSKVVNAGASLRVLGPLPLDAPLVVEGQLVSVDQDDRRAILTTRVTTSTPGGPPAVIGEMTVLVPLAKRGKRSKEGKAPKAPELVPDASPECTWMLGVRDARRFCLTSGDVNPLHWSTVWARVLGFRSTILHGFAQFARASVALQDLHEGQRVASMDARFVRPLVLPATVHFFRDESRWFVGKSPGAEALALGNYAMQTPGEP